MTASEQTYQQIERALRKAASKFDPQAECMPLTDIYLQVRQEGGELRISGGDYRVCENCGPHCNCGCKCGKSSNDDTSEK